MGGRDAINTDWWQDWTGHAAVIVASGPSAKKANVEAVRGRAKVVAINESWRLCPWADVLYAADGAWWIIHQGIPDFAGLKVSQDKRACATFADIRRVEVAPIDDTIRLDERGKIGSGGNSGFQGFNLALQFGANPIALVGFDMQAGNGMHWHGPHDKKKLRNPNERVFLRWRKALDMSARMLKARGISVYNASAVSALTAFPKVTLEEFLDERRVADICSSVG